MLEYKGDQEERAINRQSTVQIELFPFQFLQNSKEMLEISSCANRFRGLLRYLLALR